MEEWPMIPTKVIDARSTAVVAERSFECPSGGADRCPTRKAVFDPGSDSRFACSSVRCHKRFGQATYIGRSNERRNRLLQIKYN